VFTARYKPDLYLHIQVKCMLARLNEAVRPALGVVASER